jgi:CheY-like chemotaxis protein
MPAEQTAKGRLLLVDDDALFRESLGHNLLDEGYDVTSADGGEAALDHLGKDAQIDAVLLDWRMPGLDGLAVLRQMRERGHTMPVLFLTALTDNVYEETALLWAPSISSASRAAFPSSCSGSPSSSTGASAPSRWAARSSGAESWSSGPPSGVPSGTAIGSSSP